MKIYFAGSIRGGRQDKELYAEIITLLQQYGEVLTEHIGDQTLSALGDDGPSDQYIYERDMVWLHECDIIVAEVTQTSLGVGYELGFGESLGKEILCLYRPQEGKVLSAMLTGSSGMKVVEYEKVEELKELFDKKFLLFTNTPQS